MPEEIDITTVMKLMAIPGEAGRELRIQEEVIRRLREMGVPDNHIAIDEAHKHSMNGGETGNLIVFFPGEHQGEQRMLTTHLDTVPGAVGCKPRREGYRVINAATDRALGADARAGVAVLLAAARDLIARRGQHPPRTFVFFVQEEVGLLGSKHLDLSLLGNPLPSECYNFDGVDAEELSNAIIGTERMNIQLKGVAAHTGRIQQGISCAVIEADALASLFRNGWVGLVEKDGRLAHTNLGVLNGGTGSNVTMPELYALMECRSFDLAFREEILQNWRDAFNRAVEAANGRASCYSVEGRATVSFSQGPEYKPYELPTDHPMVLAAAAAIRKTGRTPRLFRHPGGTDSNNIVAHGIPSVTLGMGLRQAHSIHEWLDLEHFLDACCVAIELASGVT